MKQYPIYEVQKMGVTIEFDPDFRRAESAYHAAAPGQVKLMKLDPTTCKKSLIRSK